MAAVSPPETCSGAAPRPTDPSHHPQSHEKRPGHISCHHRIAISPSSGLPPSHSSAPTSTSPVCHHLMCLFHPQKNWKRFFTSSILAAILLCTLLYEPFGWAKPVRSSELDQVNFELSFKVYNASTQHSEPRQSDETENSILNAAPILGFYEQSSAKLSDWMSNVPDDTPITSMSIPGTHDAATWNYTQATQDSLEAVTGKIPPAIAYQCQDRSLFQMLGDGIRFFDLRVGFLPDHQQLGFFHASALLSTTATLPDVLLGFYKWLDHHPTETILVSIKVDNATFGNPPSEGQPSSKNLQLMLYDLLTQSDVARNHWLQEDSKLGTLGGARGKMIFIQRIDWDEVRNGRGEYRPIGIPLPPRGFLENGKNFTMVYNAAENARAFVEDFYDILPYHTPLADKFSQKFDAVHAHLRMAASQYPDTVDQLFITFASGEALRNLPPVTPKMLAIGTGEEESLKDSVNGRIERLLVEQYGGGGGVEWQRLGILIFDWYHHLPGLIQLVINQNPLTPPSSPLGSPSDDGLSQNSYLPVDDSQYSS